MKRNIAKVLLDIGAVGFVVDKPITFKSGIVSPVYVDNRKLPYYPDAWRVVLESFVEMIKQKGLEFEVVAGIESAGIPHSAALGYLLGKPSVFCRKQVKGHGTKKLIEGGSVTGMKVLLLEDHITTGGSSLAGVEAIRAEGGVVSHCIAITSYGFAEAEAAFERAGVKLNVLVTFGEILEEAVERGMIDDRQRREVERWMRD